MNRADRVLSCFAIGVSLLVMASPGRAVQSDSTAAAAHRLDAMESAVFQQDLANLVAPIKSKRSLKRHLDSGVDESPLRYLSEPALQRFIASLEFDQGGLTTYRYADLEAELTPSQIYQVLSLFGQQHNTQLMRGALVKTALDAEIMGRTLPGTRDLAYGQCDIYVSNPIESPDCGDRKDFRCIEPGACAPSTSLLCTKNC